AVSPSRPRRRFTHIYAHDQGLTLGWIELSWFPVQLALNLSGGEQALVKAIPLVWRDHWLLKWVAAGMPDRPLPGQPKAWEFRLADLRKLADRLEASMPSHDYSRAVEDDIQFGTAFDPE
ncbi:MAG TPA: hypothetical protein VG432_14955, partial [Gemmatimonadaceae bacterium]|nr:hypothetical protein [Gemmatimonadaceae bacterium]